MYRLQVVEYGSTGEQSRSEKRTQAADTHIHTRLRPLTERTGDGVGTRKERSVGSISYASSRKRGTACLSNRMVGAFVVPLRCCGRQNVTDEAQENGNGSEEAAALLLPDGWGVRQEAYE